MKVGDLVKVKKEFGRDPSHAAKVGVVVRLGRGADDRCEVCWTTGVTTVPLLEILEILGECKKDKIN